MLWLVCGFLLIISSGNLQAQTFRIADSLYAAGLYRDAGIACEQVAFDNSENNVLVTEALLRKCNCLKADNRISEIYLLLKRCDTPTLSDSLKSMVFFEQALAAYIDGNYAIARKSIEPLISLTNDPVMELSGVFLYSLILDETGNWEESKNNLLSYVRHSTVISDTQRDSLAENIAQLYDSSNYPKLKKIKKARLLSMLLPGTGQIYAGKSVRGLIVFSLVAASGVYVYYSIVNELYLAAAVGFYVGETFYLGNVNQLNGIVSNRNQHKKDHYNASVKLALSSLHNKILHP
jgi:TM2 domain-containing membrane protein YozV